MLRRREDKEDPSSYYFPLPNLMTGWRGRVEVDKKEIGLILG
jgi:hypothetical protein